MCVAVSCGGVVRGCGKRGVAEGKYFLCHANPSTYIIIGIFRGGHECIGLDIYVEVTIYSVLHSTAI
jgi:hypothetical protein